MPKFLTAEEYLRKKGLVSGREVLARRVKFTDADTILSERNGKDGADGRDGRDGRDGKDGRDGLAGRDGAGLNWRGNWSEKESYSKNDVVNYLGSSYVATADNSKDYPNRVNNNWDLMAASGAAGARGPQGEAGPTLGVPTFIQETRPDHEGSYVWVQTGMGDGGCNYTVWYNICEESNT
jgi:hypothetical protein